MQNDRQFDPRFLFDRDIDENINIPVSFIHDLARASSLQQVLDVMANWVFLLFSAERASITIQEDDTSLKIYSITGSHAIPFDFLVPIDGTFVGRVFSSQTLTICDDLSQSNDLDCKMLSQYGMGCCMDAPMIHGNECIGTLNVAHRETNYYSQEQAVILQCLASWLALNIKLHLQVSEMQVLASTDFLTGASNRRIFIIEGGNKFLSFKDTGTSFTVGILDLDHFKILNDQHGHDAGDLVLKSMAAVVREHVRESDLFARIGGEEFAIIVSNCSVVRVSEVFENIRGAIENMGLHYNGERLNVTASIGVSSSTVHDADFDVVLKRADNALYSAKRNGRNRVEFNFV
ncbi:MAG: sensor domain-containing diguanylate cyclase [Acinetobacter sp.]